MKKTYLFILFINLLVTVIAQPGSKNDTITRLAAESFINNQKFTGVSTAILQKGKTYLYHYGSSNKNKDQTIYEIGSVSKSFAGLILAHAILEHKVKLEDDIRKYLQGDYPNLSYQGTPVKLLHLVNWTSRLPNNMPDAPDAFKMLASDSIPFAFVRSHADYTRAKLLDDLHKISLDTIPGLLPRHSNTAARVLVYILENVYRQTYAELLKRYIFRPLGMKHTYLFVPDDETKFIATGYSASGLAMPYIPEHDIIAFGIKSSIGDMARYVQYQLSEKDAAVKLVHQATWGDTTAFAIGIGWFMEKTWDGKRKISSDGTTFGFTTYILLYPAIQFGLVMMSNEYDNNSNNRLGGSADYIFNNYFYSAIRRASDGFGFSKAINQLLQQLNKKGFDQAIPVTAALKKTFPGYKLEENEVNNWSYSLLNKGKQKQALEIFRLNVSLYPESANVYDSLGEIYMLLGDKQNAIKNYERSLELNPQNANAEEQLKKLRK